MVANAGTATGYLDLNIAGFIQGLDTALAQTGVTMSGIDAKIAGGFKNLGGKLSGLGTALTAGLTVPFAGLMGAAVNVSTKFESAMAQVQAVSGATGDDFAALREKALEMGASTKFSASESADALYYMALAGWDTNDMLNGISGVMDLAAASGEDLAHVSDIVTDGLTAFGMSAQDSNHFADVLAQTMARSNTDVNMLGEAFKYVGPVAGAFGYSVEDVSIALGLMANAGIKSSSAGTSLRQALVQLTSPSDTARQYMEKFGISLFNSDGSAKDLMSIMTDLRGTFKLTNVDIGEATKAAEAGDEAWAEYAAGLNLPANEQEKLTALTEIFGARAMPAMLALIQASDEDFNTLASSIYNCDGAASQMSETMLNTFSGQLTLLKSALEGLGIQIGDMLLPHLKNFVSHIQDLVDWLSQLTPAQKEVVLKLAGFAAAIGPVLVVLGKMVTGIGGVIGAIGNMGGNLSKMQGTLTAFRESMNFANGSMMGPIQNTSQLGTAIGKLQAKFAGLGGPILAVVAVIAVLVAAFMTLWNTNEDFRNAITGIWEGVVNSFNIFCQGIVDRLNDLGFNFQNITEVISAIWTGFCNLLAPVFEGAFSLLATVFQTVLDVLLGILDVFIGLFTGNWEQLGHGLQSIFGGIWEGIINIFNVFAETFIGIVDVFLGWFGTSWEELFGGGEGGGLSQVFADFWNGLMALAQPFFDWIASTFGPVLDSIRELWDACWSGLQDVFSTFWNAFEPVLSSGLEAVQTIWGACWEAIQKVFQTVWDAIKGVIDAIWPVIQSVLENGLNVLKTLFESVWNIIKTVVETAMKVIQDIIKTITAAVKGDWSQVWENIKKIAQDIWDGIKNIVSTILDAIKNVIQSVLDAVKGIIETIFNAIKGIIENVMNTIKTIWETIWNAIKTIAETIFNAIKSTIENILNGIKSIWENIWNAVKSVAENIWNGIKSLIEGAINAVQSTISNILNGISSTWSNIWGNIRNFISDTWNNMKSVVSDGVNAVGNFISELPGRITGIFANAGSLLIGAGRAIIEGLLNGLRSAVGAVWDFVGGIASKIASIKGPLDYDKKLLIPAGNAIMAGLQKGLADGFDSVQDDVSLMAGAMADELGDGEKNKWYDYGFTAGQTVFVGFSDAVSGLEFSQIFSVGVDGANSLNNAMIILCNTVGKLRAAVSGLSQTFSGLSQVSLGAVNDAATNLGNNLHALPMVTIDYDMLAQTLYDMFARAPVQNNIDVVMSDGSVYLDNERVGRSVAPVVSRVLARQQNIK